MYIIDFRYQKTCNHTKYRFYRSFLQVLQVFTGFTGFYRFTGLVASLVKSFCFSGLHSKIPSFLILLLSLVGLSARSSVSSLRIPISIDARLV